MHNFLCVTHNTIIASQNCVNYYYSIGRQCSVAVHEKTSPFKSTYTKQFYISVFVRLSACHKQCFQGNLAKACSHKLSDMDKCRKISKPGKL